MLLSVLWLFMSLIRVADCRYVNSADARDYLIKFGYVAPPDPRTGNLVSLAEYQKSIREFQQMMALPETGNIDNDTLTVMNLPRCGVSDKLGTAYYGAKRRKKRFTLQGSRWFKSSIKYFFDVTTTQMSDEEQRHTVAKAWQIWSDRANLQVREARTRAEADIIISFAHSFHGDSYPFDGNGGVLAHAFFPDRGGDTHFDDQEVWTVNNRNTQGVDFLFTAVHEFGHALGLAHSDVRNSIMAPVYPGFIPELSLHSDDQQAIQALYGKPKHTTRTTENIPLPDVHKSASEKDKTILIGPDLCQDSSFDAITTTADETTYVFKGDYYWKLLVGVSVKLASGFPRKIADDWPTLTGNIDTVFTDYTGRTFFIKGDVVWEFRNRVLVQNGSSLSARFRGLPLNIQASFTWSGNGKIYVIKGMEYYSISDNGSVTRGYPRNITIWKGLPYGRINAAINFLNSRTYFFSGQSYYRFNDRTFNVDAGYPLPIGSRWFGCETGLISQEGLYNRQWLEANDSSVWLPSYPQDQLIGGRNNVSSSCCITFHWGLFVSTLVLIKCACP